MRDRFKLEEGWGTLLFILIAMLMSGALAIQQADLMSGLTTLTSVAIASVFTGFVLSHTRFSDNTAHLFSLIYGLAFLIFIIGTSSDELSGLTTRETIINLFNRQAEWVYDAFSGDTNRDGLIFVIHTSAVFWLLGYTAAWYTFHKPRVWRVVIPTGLVLLSVVYYYYGPEP